MKSLIQAFATRGCKAGCLFDAAERPSIHAQVVCHEIRCPTLGRDERAFASFQVMDRHDGVFDTEVGDMIEIGSLEIESIIYMRVYASGRSKAGGYSTGRRACGEVHIPIKRLLMQFDGMLYRTWLMLESPDLVDSVASTGLLGPGNEGQDFEQALHNGPRQLTQTQVCVTFCRAEELGSNGFAEWDLDASEEQVIARWGPLLQSQRQHVILCAAQQLQLGAQRSRDKTQTREIERQMQVLNGRAREQAEELEHLRETLRKTGRRVIEAEEGNRLDQTRRQHLDHELDAERQLHADLKQEMTLLRDELNKIGDEAEAKIGSANIRIVALRDERNEFAEQTKHQVHANRRLRIERDELTTRKAALTDEKEALMKSLEELDQTCNIAGLTLGLQGIRDMEQGSGSGDT